MTMTDWNKEAEQIGSSNFWKPETGQYKLKFLNDGQPTTFEDKRSGRITEQVDFAAEVEGQEKIWTVTRARKVNSLYGQLVLLGRRHGAISGKELTLFVKFDKSNNKREYTIQEALGLIENWDEKHANGIRQKKEPSAASDGSFFAEQGF
jgi:hypothetical protein